MSKFYSLIFFCLATFCVQGQADSSHQQHICFQSKKNKWLAPAAAAGYAGATMAVYAFLDSKIQKATQANRSKFQTFVSSSITDIGLGKTQTLGLIGTSALAFVIKDQKLKKTAIIWGGSLLINTTVTHVTKNIFQRHRPYSGHPYNSFDWSTGPKEHLSFISAHTSNIFTTATVFATNYKDVKWVPPVAYGLATLVAWSRVYDNAHWASDVMAGAAVGFLSAKAMNALYNWAGKKIHFLPQVGPHHASVSVVYSL